MTAMINNRGVYIMYVNKRLKRIDNFFKNLNVQEFDEILEKAGINFNYDNTDTNKYKKKEWEYGRY